MNADVAENQLFEGMISVRAIIEAGAAGINNRKIVTLYYDSERTASHSSEYAWLCHRAEETGFGISLCSRETVARICTGNSHGGIAALCSTRDAEPDGEITGGFWAYAEGLEDPYNFGYSLRSLYAAGADGVIVGECNRLCSSPTICRASAGASERLRLRFGDAEVTADRFRSAGYTVVCADRRDAVPMWEAKLKKPLLLIIGGEKRGITRRLLNKCDMRVSIEYARPFNEALSAASAATVLAFEVARQNRG